MKMLKFILTSLTTFIYTKVYIRLQQFRYMWKGIMEYPGGMRGVEDIDIND